MVREHGGMLFLQVAEQGPTHVGQLKVDLNHLHSEQLEVNSHS